MEIVAKITDDKGIPSPPAGLMTYCKGCYALLRTDGKENGSGKIVIRKDKGYSIPAWELLCPACGKKKVQFFFPIEKEPYKNYFLELNGLSRRGV